jgi:hypothetical protein
VQANAKIERIMYWIFFKTFFHCGSGVPLFPGKIKWILNLIVDGFHFVLRREKKQ